MLLSSLIKSNTQINPLNFKDMPESNSVNTRNQIDITLDGLNQHNANFYLVEIRKRSFDYVIYELAFNANSCSRDILSCIASPTIPKTLIIETTEPPSRAYAIISQLIKRKYIQKIYMIPLSSKNMYDIMANFFVKQQIVPINVGDEVKLTLRQGIEEYGTVLTLNSVDKTASIKLKLAESSGMNHIHSVPITLTVPLNQITLYRSSKINI